MITLYENNAGHLFLSDGTTVYAGLENVQSTFAEDAQCLLAGDTANWNLETYSAAQILAEMPKLIATYTAAGGVDVEQYHWEAPRAGTAGLRYLGLPE